MFKKKWIIPKVSTENLKWNYISNLNLGLVLLFIVLVITENKPQAQTVFWGGAIYNIF